MGLDYLGPILLSFVTCLNNVFGVSVPCGETYLAKNGHRCYPCSAGYYKVGDCMIDGEQSRCRPCGYGEYLSTCDNSTQCNPCDLFCHGGQIEIKACTPTSNLKCQCKDGYYWKTDPHRNCIRHSKCIPGEGLKTKGTPYEDTICEPCKNGTSYSNLTSFNECTPCSVCNITQISCNSIHDTVCGSKAGGTTNTLEADSDYSWVAVVVGSVSFVVGGFVGFVGFRCIRHVRHRNIKLFEEEKPEHVEQGLGNDFISTHVDTTGPGCDLSRSRDGTANHNNNNKEATPASGERQNDPAETDSNPFKINQAFDPDLEDDLETEKSKGQDRVIFQLKTGNSSSNQLQPSCAYTEEIETTLENKNDEKPDKLSSSQNDNCSINSNESCQNKGMQSDKDFTDDKDSLSNDTDLTVDASAVAPRTLPPEVDEEGNSNHLEEAEVDDMEICGDGSVNSLGQDREGVQCQRNSIENDSVDTERVVLDPVDLSDIVTAATEISRTEESRKSTFWFEVVDYLQDNTNEEFSETIDVVIENSGEGNEGKYQILKRWREATPNAQLKDVIGAMKHYNLNALCADIIDKLNDKNLLDTDGDLLDTEISQNRNDHSLYPRNDLFVQDADTGIEENDLAQGGHLKMEDLKSFKCEDDDAWCIS